VLRCAFIQNERISLSSETHPIKVRERLLGSSRAQARATLDREFPLKRRLCLNMLASDEKCAEREGKRTPSVPRSAVSVPPTYGKSRNRDTSSHCGPAPPRRFWVCLLTADGSRRNSSRPKAVLAGWNGRRHASAGPWSFLRRRSAPGEELHRPEPAGSLSVTRLRAFFHTWGRRRIYGTCNAASRPSQAPMPNSQVNIERTP
jgi:hypothetical protein